MTMVPGVLPPELFLLHIKIQGVHNRLNKGSQLFLFAPRSVILGPIITTHEGSAAV
jgi:hypothetical protein